MNYDSLGMALKPKIPRYYFTFYKNLTVRVFAYFCTEFPKLCVSADSVAAATKIRRSVTWLITDFREMKSTALSTIYYYRFTVFRELSVSYFKS